MNTLLNQSVVELISIVEKVSVQKGEGLENIFVQHAKLLPINVCEQQLIFSMKSVVFYLITAHAIINAFNVLLFYPCLEIIIIADMLHAEPWKQ